MAKSVSALPCAEPVVVTASALRNQTLAKAGVLGVVTALAVDPQTPSIIYAGTSGGGVFKSADGGGSWSAINTGLSNLYVADLVIDPQTPTTLYLITDTCWCPDTGAFQTTDGGATWSAIVMPPAGLYATCPSPKHRPAGK